MLIAALFLAGVFVGGLICAALAVWIINKGLNL